MPSCLCATSHKRLLLGVRLQAVLSSRKEFLLVSVGLVSTVSQNRLVGKWSLTAIKTWALIEIVARTAFSPAENATSLMLIIIVCILVDHKLVARSHLSLKWRPGCLSLALTLQQWFGCERFLSWWQIGGLLAHFSLATTLSAFHIFDQTRFHNSLHLFLGAILNQIDHIGSRLVVKWSRHERSLSNWQLQKVVQLLLDAVFLNHNALCVSLSFLDDVKVKDWMSSFDPLNCLLGEINFVFEQLWHLDVSLAHVSDWTAFVRLADSLHEQVRAVVACQVFSLQQGLGVSTFRVAFIVLTGTLETWHRQLFLNESTIEVFVDAIETAFGRFA